MELVKELLLLNEASTAGRAWEGKLKKIDALLAWMYDKDILTKGEKAKKDSIFRAYYRYYNDGDMPKSLALKGFSKYSEKGSIEKALEAYLEDFIKSLLSKYLPKVDRAEFRIDKMLSDLSTVIDVSERHDAHGLLEYWLKTVKINDPELILSKLVDELKEQYDKVKTEADSISPSTDNLVMSHRLEKMKTAGESTKTLDKNWKACEDTIDEITAFLKNLVDSLKQLKKQKFGESSE